MASRGAGRSSSRTADPKSELPERADIAGHRVEVRRTEGREELFIDGERRVFFKSSAGYHLLEDAYHPAEPSLLQAARRTLERRAERR